MQTQAPSPAPARTNGAALASALEDFTAAHVEHLDDEEAHVVPLIRAHITAEEWTRLMIRGWLFLFAFAALGWAPLRIAPPS